MHIADRICKEHEIHPIIVFGCAIEALTIHDHRNGIVYQPGQRAPNVIESILSAANENKVEVPTSILSAIDLLLMPSFNMFTHNAKVLRDKGDVGERSQQLELAAKAIKVMRLIIRECINENERSGIEVGIENENRKPPEVI